MIKILFVVAFTLLLSLVGAHSVRAADYPDQVRKEYLSECIKTADKGKGVSKREARAYCRSTLNCLEDKLTLKRFRELIESGNFTSNKKVKACIRQAKPELG